MSASRRAAVVGGGIAGAAASLALAARGFAVTVYERHREPGAIGAGLLLQPTGLWALRRLGVAEPVLASAARVERIAGTNLDGRVIWDLGYAELRPGLCGLGIHRGALFDALHRASRAREGVSWRTGITVAALDVAPGGVRVRDADGVSEPFDLVVIANGLASELADRPGLRGRRPLYPWGALWTVLPDPDRRFAGALWQRYDGASRMAGVLPCGAHPDGSGPCVSLFWSIRHARYESWRAAPLAAWKDELRAFWPMVAELVEPIVDPQQLLLASYRDVARSRWHDGRVVVIGDAAHATSPQLGQGANLALIDAVVLGDCLADGTLGIEQALRRYSRERAAHLRFYQLASRWMTPWFQSDSRVLGWLRDTAIPLMHRTPLTRRLMVEVLAGLRLLPFGRLDRRHRFELE